MTNECYSLAATEIQNALYSAPKGCRVAPPAQYAPNTSRPGSTSHPGILRPSTNATNPMANIAAFGDLTSPSSADSDHTFPPDLINPFDMSSSANIYPNFATPYAFPFPSPSKLFDPSSSVDFGMFDYPFDPDFLSALANTSQDFGMGLDLGDYTNGELLHSGTVNPLDTFGGQKADLNGNHPQDWMMGQMGVMKNNLPGTALQSGRSSISGMQPDSIATGMTTCPSTSHSSPIDATSDSTVPTATPPLTMCPAEEMDLLDAMTNNIGRDNQRGSTGSYSSMASWGQVERMLADQGSDIGMSGSTGGGMSLEIQTIPSSRPQAAAGPSGTSRRASKVKASQKEEALGPPPPAKKQKKNVSALLLIVALNLPLTLDFSLDSSRLAPNPHLLPP